MKTDPATIETETGAIALAWQGPIDLPAMFARLAARRHCLFLDSAAPSPTLGRYSFLAADPFEYIEVSPISPACDPWSVLRTTVERFRTTTIAGLPPFQGGVAGLLGYDLNRSLEAIPAPTMDEFQLPALALGLYDVVLAIDHAADRAWIISQGFPEQNPQARRQRALARAADFRDWLSVDQKLPKRPASPSATKQIELAARHTTAHHGVLSNLSHEQYLAMIARAVEYVHAGDVFQVNLAHRLVTPAREPASALYLRLRRENPAPFAAYFDLGQATIVSASPERFLRATTGQVEARPIKGTSPRSPDPAIDRQLAASLAASQKDQAENVMIVDLLRNDLSRVCRPESVRVTQLCQVESYPFVHHLVSAVCGTLAEGRTSLDLLQAAFPGGSVTGAPKVRAMQIIAELEPTARGAYCGSLAYLGFDGTLDASILIRTITAAGGWWQFPVGGGIVAQSDPQQEYEESWHKAAGILRALKPRRLLT